MICILWKFLQYPDQGREERGEIPTVARHEPDAAVGLESEGAVAVELKLVLPIRPLGQPIDRPALHRLDEASLCLYRSPAGQVWPIFS